MAATKSELGLECLVFFLAVGLWFAAAPMSISRDLSPAELIENGLPAKQTMKTASKSDFLSAICAAVRKNRKSGAEVTATAVEAREGLAGEIVGTVLRCGRGIDCAYVDAIVSAALKARPAAAITISDAATAKAPNCGETIQAAVRTAAQRDTAASPTEPSAPVGPRPEADEGFDPREPLVLVCADGAQRAIRKSLVEEFMTTHPGSYLGSCPPPASSPAPSLTPTPHPAPAPNPIR